MSAPNIYMEYLHPSMYSMQVSPAQYGFFDYKLLKAEKVESQKDEIIELRKKLDETENTLPG